MWVTAACLGQTEGPLARAPGFVPVACTGFLETYSLNGYLAQPRYIREDIGEMCFSLSGEWMGAGWGNK